MATKKKSTKKKTVRQKQITNNFRTLTGDNAPPSWGKHRSSGTSFGLVAMAISSGKGIFGKLKPAHQRFVFEYLKDGNAAAAMYRAGLVKCGTSPAVVRIEARRLATLPFVSSAIEAANAIELAHIENDTRITKRRVIEELANIAFADLSNVIYWDEDGTRLIPSELLNGEVTSAISEIRSEMTETMVAGGGRQKKTKHYVKLHDKLAALRDLGKALGLFTEEENNGKNMVVVVPGQMPQDADQWAEVFANPGHSLSNPTREHMGSKLITEAKRGDVQDGEIVGG